MFLCDHSTGYSLIFLQAIALFDKIRERMLVGNHHQTVRGEPIEVSLPVRKRAAPSRIIPRNFISSGWLESHQDQISNLTVRPLANAPAEAIEDTSVGAPQTDAMSDVDAHIDPALRGIGKGGPAGLAVVGPPAGGQIPFEFNQGSGQMMLYPMPPQNQSDDDEMYA